MKVVLIGPGEGSELAKLIAKEFESQGISILELKNNYKEVSVEISDAEFHLKNLIHDYKMPDPCPEPIIQTKERSYSTKFRD